MNFRPIGFILGCLVIVIGLAMTIPLAMSLLRGDGEWSGFVAAIFVAGFVGGVLVLGQWTNRIEVDRRQAFLLTSLAWTVLPIFGALPLLWSGHGLRLIDAIFESVSGLTTTGSTILVGLDSMEPSVLLWRSMLQWVGGVGIIAMGIAILPFLRVGGMQIFRMESSDQSDKVVPRADQLALLLLGVYAGMSVLCALCYWIAGMSAFEAVNHAMTTLSTGGYSTSDASMGHFDEPALHWIATAFMLLGSLPFVLYIQALRGRPMLLVNDWQVRTFISLLVLFSLILAYWLMWRDNVPWSTALRLAAFNVTSIITTTGYAVTDYTDWGNFAIVALYFLTFVGGCSGSTAGGLKIYRLLVLMHSCHLSMRRLIRPNGVFSAKYNGKPITIEAIGTVSAFVVVYTATIVLLAMGLAMTGLDFATSLSGAATAVANVGPGIGTVIGPAGNFASLSDTAKWLLCLGMILGRLEIYTLAVLVAPDFWRR